MPRVIVTEGAARGLERCQQFLADKDPDAARRAASTIKYYFTLLEQTPDIGRPLDGRPELRELPIPFGDSGFVGLYHHDSDRQRVLVLAFRHQREAGYGLD